MRVGQVLAVEPLLGQAQAGAVHRQELVSVPVLDPLDTEDGAAGPVEQSASGLQQKRDAGVVQQRREAWTVPFGARGQDPAQGVRPGDR
ncbi:hypothetical protein SAVCW2_22610 [Streptomyces avermitilis]|nr:hypothetical protein SAVCW2_22610 [Streptomyces avermitilis]